MPTKLDKQFKRQVMLHGLRAPVNIIFNKNGVEMSVAGFRKRVFASWEHIAKNLHTPTDAPSFLHEDSWRFLQYQDATLKAKEQKHAKMQEV